MLRKKMLVAAVALALVSPNTGWAANLVTNGDFSSYTNTGGQMGVNTTVTDWATTGYNFLFPSASAAMSGVPQGGGTLALWGPGNGSNNGFGDPPTSSTFLGADGAFEVGAITQTIGGLTVGQNYEVSFYWAAAQQSGFTGANTEQWVVGFGSATQSTGVFSNASEGFSGWMYQTFTFAADSTSDVLSFLAVGTPSGVPPFSLLADVSVNSVPEPTAVVLLGLGVLGLGVVRLRNRIKSATI
jgi:PEP-CTERM motif